MNILTLKDEKVYRKNAGIITKPSNYELHWYAEFKDESRMEMFENETPESRRSFKEVQVKGNLNFAIWRGVNNPDLHFGITFEYDYPKFLFGGNILSPLSSLYYSGKEFYPDLFIRNVVPIITGMGQATILDEEKEMIYFAGFKFKVKDQVHGMYLAFNGHQVKSEGFDNFEICGGYRLDV